jgi:hypothetical protein
MNKSLEHVIRQVDSARADLAVLEPRQIDWYVRSVESAKELIPWLVRMASPLKQYVEGVLNSPSLLRQKWIDIRPDFRGHEDDIRLIDECLRKEKILLDQISGNIVSLVVEQFLIESHPQRALESNGKSDYPDLYLKSKDYTGLPLFSRSGSEEYGASLKGKKRRPVRIPDGLEVKTCKGEFSVDCHYPHIGLHLAVLFNEKGGSAQVGDIMVAFLRSCDYREAKRETLATTVKYSFNGQRFISILQPI